MRSLYHAYISRKSDAGKIALPETAGIPFQLKRNFVSMSSYALLRMTKNFQTISKNFKLGTIPGRE